MATYTDDILVWDGDNARTQKIANTDLLTLGSGANGGLVVGGALLGSGEKLTVTGAASVSTSLSIASASLASGYVLGATGGIAASTLLSGATVSATTSLAVASHVLGASEALGVIGPVGITGNLNIAGSSSNTFSVTATTGAVVASGTVTGATGSVFGTLTLANGSITDSSGSITFVDENLVTTGTLGCGVLTAATASTIGSLTLADGSIVDSSGAISFGDENLTTSGTLASGALTVTGNAEVTGNLNVAGDIVSSGTVDHVTADRWIEQGINPSTVQQSGGFALCMEGATAVAQTAGVFAIGASSTGPTITCSATVSGVAAENIITIQGSDSNDGTYVVKSVSGASIVIYGTGGTALPASCPFAQNQFVGETDATATIVVVESIAALGFSAGSIPKTGGSIAAGDMCTMYWRGTSGAGYLITSSDAVWEVSGVTSLQDAYGAGATITLDGTSGGLTVAGYGGSSGGSGDVTFGVAGASGSTTLDAFTVGSSTLDLDTSGAAAIDTVGATTWTATGDFGVTVSAGFASLSTTSTNGADYALLKSDVGYVRLLTSGWSSSTSSAPAMYIAARKNTGFNAVIQNRSGTALTLAQGDMAITAGYGQSLYFGIEASGGALAKSLMTLDAEMLEIGVPLSLTNVAGPTTPSDPTSTHLAVAYVYDGGTVIEAGTCLEMRATSMDVGAGATVYIVMVPVASDSESIDGILMEDSAGVSTGSGQMQALDIFPCIAGAAVAMPVAATIGGTAVVAGSTLTYTDGAGLQLFMDYSKPGQLCQVAPTSGDVFLAGKPMARTADSNGNFPIKWIGQRILSL